MAAATALAGVGFGLMAEPFLKDFTRQNIVILRFHLSIEQLVR